MNDNSGSEINVLNALSEAAGLDPSHVRGWLEDRHGPEPDRAASAEQLRNLWGSDYDANVERINGYLSQHAAAGEALRSSPWGSDAATLVRLGNLAKAPRPKLQGSVQTQINEIQAFMRENRDAYNKDASLQSLYRQLVNERDSAKG